VAMRMTGNQLIAEAVDNEIEQFVDDAEHP
jgi:hypothetical protein